MNGYKVTIVGAGNVGASVCYELARKDICSHIVLIDTYENIATGKALDIAQALSICNSSTKVSSTIDYKDTQDSHIVVVTAGSPRKPGMSRDDLLLTNAKITKDIIEQVAKHSPESIIIEVANPLDAMVHVALKTSGFKRNKVFGMAGILDCGRMETFIAQKLQIAYGQVSAMVLGGHGESMVPLPRYTTINGIEVSHFLDEETLDKIIQMTQDGGAQIVSYLNTSAYYAPAMATVTMVEAILKDSKALLPCAALLDGEYGYKNVISGVPVVLGSDGIEKIEVLSLNDKEKESFDKSIQIVKNLIQTLKKNGY